MEKLETQEKIMLSSNQIVFMTNQIYITAMQMSMIDIGKKRADKHMEFLKEISANMLVILNKIGDYMNDCDIVTELDCHLFDNIFEKLNEEE